MIYRRTALQHLRKRLAHDGVAPQWLIILLKLSCRYLHAMLSSMLTFPSSKMCISGLKASTILPDTTPEAPARSKSTQMHCIFRQ